MCCDNSVREKDWRCHKRGIQATRARQGDLARVTRTRQYQRQWFERMHTNYFGIIIAASVTTGYLSFGPMAQCVVHALRSQKKNIICFQWVQNLGTLRYSCAD